MKLEKTDDLESIEELCGSNQYISKPTENHDKRDFYLLKKNGKNIGCGYTRTFPGKIGTMGSIFIDKKYRNQGMGEYLVKKLEEEIEELGSFFIVIGVHRDNENGMEFWKGLNYHILIESLGEDVFTNDTSREFFEKISPVPLPNKGITLMGKRLVGRGKLEYMPFYNELSDLKDKLGNLKIDMLQINTV
ncbi:MAG: GNAT family N-acetyltransferase [Candidatus Aenigmatarchaeota archaeon]